MEQAENPKKSRRERLFKMKKALIILFILPHVVFSQVESPPTLALGVAGVVGEKGSIDVDILAEIISEKQAELKKEFIKKSMFNDLENKSYVVWEYMYSSINVLLESDSKDAIKQNLLKNTSNLALVFGLSELYLQLSSSLCNSDLYDLLAAYDSAYKSNEFRCPASSSKVFTKIELATLKKYKNKEVSFSAFFLDLVFEVLRNNKTVTDLGFLTEPLPLDKSYYQSHSAYFKVAKVLPKETASLKERMSNEIQVLFDNYTLIRKWSKTNVNLDSLVKLFSEEVNLLNSQNRITDNGGNPIAVKKLFETLTGKASRVYSDIKSKNSPLGTSLSSSGGNTAIAYADNKSSTKDLSEAIEKNLAAFTRFVGKGADFDQNDLFYLEKSIRPLLVRLVSENGFDPKYLQIAEDLEKLITTELLKKLQALLKASKLSNLSQKKISTFNELLDFITRLDELDKVETYQFVLKTLREASEIFEDKKLGFYLKIVIDNLDKYTIINSKDNKVEIAVEDIIARIYEKYANRQSSVFGLYFSVGINQSISSNFNYQTLLPNSTGFKTDSLKSVAFVSEKIGLKVKLIDYKWRRSFSVGETYATRVTGIEKTVDKFKSNKPLVSDIYFLAYGSGLLYKIANLTSNKEFSDPIAGLGLGIAFFNSLDLNVGYNWPLQSKNSFFENLNKKNIWTISFDVKITEYLAAVGKKRKSKK